MLACFISLNKKNIFADNLLLQYDFLIVWQAAGAREFAMERVFRLRSLLGVLGFISVLCICGADAYTPVDNYLISCGSSVDTPVGRRLFLADDNSGSVTLTSRQSTAAEASPGSVSGFANAAMYRTARVFAAPSSYSFRIRAPGRHFLRLHFFPFVHQGGDLAAAASFKVSTQDAVLIDRFRPPAVASGRGPSPACEEFLLAVARDTLIVTFLPLDGGVAFVNAVEVVSVPDDLVASSANTLNAAGPQPIPAVLPLQTIHRVNVGGPAVAADNDTLWREWATDRQFLIGIAGTEEVAYAGRLSYLAGMATPDDAPDVVYGTARELVMSNWVDTSFQMTWRFAIDVPASYLIRFHLCDIVSKAPHLLPIDVYVGSYMAMKDFDLSAIGNGTLAFPYYTDFILDSSDASGKLVISIGSSSVYNKSSATGPFLNGLEIMKIHRSAGDVVVVEPTAGAGKARLAVVLGSVCGALAVVSIAVVVVAVLRKKNMKGMELPTRTPSQPSTPWMPLLGRISFRSPGASATASRSPSFTVATNSIPPGASPAMAASPIQSYRFPFATLQEATRNFDESLVVGEGGFGKVYAAVLPDGAKVAAKRVNPESRQGAREFRAEIELLSGLRHRHLVSLIGYCDEQEEMILLYEYMEHGSLRSRLYGGGSPEPERWLSWAQRLEACVGAARGLLYLHTAVAKPVIHRDVKSSNILLDGGLTAKVADFGLSKAGPEVDETHVSTAVKGSFGYVDPEYVRTRKLTAKSDVYSFGVVLLEALCGRPVVDPRLPRPMANLVEWGLHWQGRGELGKIVDRRIAGEVRPEALSKYGETAARCLADRGADRPAMEDVVWSLQFVVRLQEAVGLDVSDVNSLSMVSAQAPSPPPPYSRQRSAVESEAGTEGEGDGSSIADGDYTDVSMRGVFWRMVNVRGR